MNSYHISQGEGNTRVTLEANIVGQDMVVVITAGKAHVGAVALAVPCEKNAEGVTASCSVLTVPGHRDNIPAERAAMRLCKLLQRPISVTAGLHIDKATEEEIQLLLENSEVVVENLMLSMRGEENGF